VVTDGIRKKSQKNEQLIINFVYCNADTLKKNSQLFNTLVGQNKREEIFLDLIFIINDFITIIFISKYL